MKAIVPLNLAAVRVSSSDSSNVTPTFKGATVAFDDLPFGAQSTEASTGDTISRPLVGGPSPDPPLEPGVHLHWELPEYFKRGVQSAAGGPIVFPPAPNRWLVVRTYTPLDGSAPPGTESWVVESDYVAAALAPDAWGVTRPAVAVPLANAQTGGPAMFMGRVVGGGTWSPSAAPAADYLPGYDGRDASPLYLDAIGFVGASFSAYYPDCRSVFGFWDTFADLPPVQAAILAGQSPGFRVSYSVAGWLADPTKDPLAGLADAVRDQYDAYVGQCAAENVAVARTPLDFFHSITSEACGWVFTDAACVATLGPGDVIETLAVPDGSLCCGSVADVVWSAPAATPFLAVAGGGQSWPAQVQLAVGNTTIEAVSTLVRSELPPPTGTGVLSGYEVLLDALQLGVLRDLESGGPTLVTLEERIHSQGFASEGGGHLWVIQPQPTEVPGGSGGATPEEATLPLDLAEQLHVLNAAQQAYDQARAQLLVARQQLFMDWVIFVKQYVANVADPVVSTNALANFVATPSGGELGAVEELAAATGLLTMTVDPAINQITAPTTTSGATTAAGRVVAAFAALQAALPAGGTWQVGAAPAPPFWLPTDPVVVMQGDRIEPAWRNGPTTEIAVRVDSELISALAVSPGASPSVLVAASAVAPSLNPALPAEAAAFVAESALLCPQQVPAIAAHVSAGDTALADALAACQGSTSPLAGGAGGGLFGEVAGGQVPPGANPQVTVVSPMALSVTFTNPASTAQAPSAVGWTTQAQLPELSPTRADPFLPVWLTWTVAVEAATQGVDGTYPPSMIDANFALDPDGIELEYLMQSGRPVSFTSGSAVPYGGAIVLSKRPFQSLTDAVARYVEEFPTDPAVSELKASSVAFSRSRVMAQSLGTLGLAQTLRTTIPQIPVANLVSGIDPITDAVAAAAKADTHDDWYDSGFNALTALSTGLATANFGPLRAGFMDVRALGIIDVFGQRMDLATAALTPTGALTVATSGPLSPQTGDTVNAGRTYLPPRVLAPVRLDALWLSAAHDQAVPGVTTDFVEMSSHPATSPVGGWVVPNHLDDTLAFFDQGGQPIGSFGVEHGDLVYRTRAGNVANPGDDLATDIGPTGAPTVNPHLAQLMWFVAGRTPGFLDDLMSAMDESDQFVQPAGAAQDPAVAVLVGRPLAVARCALGLSTSGGVLPARQSNTRPTDALAQAVTNGWTVYEQRQANTSAGLGSVRFPVRLGDLSHPDDGLVAFLPEGADGSYGAVYSDTAPPSGANGVVRPAATSVELTLTGPVLSFTLLVDPRAPVHAITGFLPVTTMTIPPDQYSHALRTLAVSFVAHPLLADSRGLAPPLPDLAGLAWSWIAPGQAPSPLSPSGAAGRPVYGYSPQTVAEGWLQIAAAPPPPTPAPPGAGGS